MTQDDLTDPLELDVLDVLDDPGLAVLSGASRRPAEAADDDLLLARAMRQIGSLVLADLDAERVREAEGRVVRELLAAVPRAHGTSMSLPGVPTVGSSDATVRAADLLQFEVGEGPCLETLKTGTGHVSGDIAHDPRWRRVGPRMTASSGFVSLLAVPLVVDGSAVGALNVYSRDRDAFGSRAVRAAEELSTPGAVTVLNAHAQLAARQVADQLRGGLETRGLIGQAVGLLMATHDLGSAAALELLKRHSQAENRKLRDIAQQLVTDFEARVAGAPAAADG